jgi:hypothetical protein
MIRLTKNECIPEKISPGESPNFICFPNGDKHYLSSEEKKDYLYGGQCPKICPVKATILPNTCPNVSYVTEHTIARNQCQADPNCQFLGAPLFDKMGPHYCIPKQQPGCITLTESDYAKNDKILTDSVDVCDRLHKGCIFNRGNGDGTTARKGEPTCIKGCLGSKYWENPDYMWGGGDTTENNFNGSWFNSDLEVGPKYLESAPSFKRPAGWGGPAGTPWEGSGKLPKSLGVPYTDSKGKYSPPCNMNYGDVGSFTSAASGENLAGPGCILTPPENRVGIYDWSYTCRCLYNGDSGDIKPDAWTPCSEWELDEDTISNRDVCDGCYILDDAESKLNGRCVLGNKTMDTQSKLLGCVPDMLNPTSDKCRITRNIDPTECPAFCSSNVSDPYGWRKNTQCSKQLSSGSWKPNKLYKDIISTTQKYNNEQSNPYLKLSEDYKVKNTDYLCRNCAQTAIESTGSGTKYPNRSRCVVGGSDTSSQYSNTTYGDFLSRKLMCPSTCNQCMSGFFNEPLEGKYSLQEATDTSSVFSDGIIYVPWVGNQSVDKLKINS